MKPVQLKPLGHSPQQSRLFAWSRGGVDARKHARHQLNRRFLYSDLQPVTELGITPDPHPEGPSLLPAEAPPDVRKELARERQREGVRKAAVSIHLPRLSKVAEARDRLLKAEEHTSQGSQALLWCDDQAFMGCVRDGETLVSLLESRRRDVWFDRVQEERNDLDRETRMLQEAIRIIREEDDVATLPNNGRSRFRAECENGDLLNRGTASNDGISGSEVTTDSKSTKSSESEFRRDESATVPESSGSRASTASGRSADSSAQTTSTKMEAIRERQIQMQRIADAQALLNTAKEDAMNLMFLADRADQEAAKEAVKLKDMQIAPSHSEAAIFERRASQRRVWMLKNQAALQSRLRYQEAVEQLHKVKEEWGPAVGLEASVGTSPRTTSITHTSSLDGPVDDVSETAGSASLGGGRHKDETISLWVLGVTSVNVSSETLRRAYYGCFSESPVVPTGGWISFDEGAPDVNVHCVIHKKSRKGVPARVDTWVVDGADQPEVNGRYVEISGHDGAPRYRNPNNIFLFRHRLSRTKELGIMRQTCLPESELTGEDMDSTRVSAALAFGQEISGKLGMDFSRLVKTSLQTVNLDRQEKVRHNHERTARAVAKVDQRLQDEMTHASAALDRVEKADKPGSQGCGGSSAALIEAPRKEKHRDLAVMEASDSAKVTFQDQDLKEDKIIPCHEHGVPPLCKRWIARACPKTQIHCRCRHYFVSLSERDRMVAWRQGKDAGAELEVLRRIAKRETLLSEVEQEASSCCSCFLAETKTKVEERDVASLLALLDQLRLASVRVVEAVEFWRGDVKAARLKTLSIPAPILSQGENRASSPVEAFIESRGENPHSEAATALENRSRAAKNSSSTRRATSDTESQANGMEQEGADGRVSLQALFNANGTVENGEAIVHATSENGELSKRKSQKRKAIRDVNDRKGQRGAGGVPNGRWVVTMMVPGRKLWETSPAMISQYKRFRRSRQDPKIARNQLYLGVFSNRVEAMKAYDDALCREAVKQRSSVLRMPKKRIVTRACGKHMAIQSEDTPPGRSCEQCAARELKGITEHSTPYIWNNSNYLLKMTDDLHFLKDVGPLAGFLGGNFELQDNPFLLAPVDNDTDREGFRNDAASHPVPQTASEVARLNDPNFFGPSRPVTAPLHKSSTPISDSGNLNSHPDHRSLTSDGKPSRDQCFVGPLPSVSAVTTPRVAWGHEGSVDQDDGISCASARPKSVGGRRYIGNDNVNEPKGRGLARGDFPGAVMFYSHNDASRHREASVSPQGISERSSFGKPTTQVARFSNGVQAWCGETAQEGKFVIPFRTSDGRSEANMASYPALAATGAGPGFKPRHEVGTAVEVLDEERVRLALRTLHQEQDIADAMAGKPPRSRQEQRSAAAVSTAISRAQSNTVDGGNPAESAEEGTIDGDDWHAGRSCGDAHLKPDDRQARQRKTRDVLAVYKHRGAQLVLAQTRKPHPFRQDGIFCRADRGEWAGQVHMSINAKKFVARRLLDKALERRNEQRGRVGRMMRRLIEQGHPIHYLNGPRLRRLLKNAKSLGGDRLTIDIMEAAAALQLYGKVEGSARVIQALMRGVLGREASRRDLELRRATIAAKKRVMKAAGVVAEEVVAGLCDQALRRARRSIWRRVTATAGLYQDDRRMILSAVPVEQRDFSGGAPKFATEGWQLCSACRGRSAHYVWSCKTEQEEAFRGVCSCATVRPPETTRLTGYDPITGEKVYMLVTEKLLRKYVGQRRAGNARAQAATTALLAAGASLQPLPWDTALGYGNPRREAGAVVRTMWEPCYEAKQLLKAAELSRIEGEFSSQAARQAEAVAEKAAVVEEKARVVHETWKMIAEDVAGRYWDLVMDFMSACEKSREALAFSWRSVQQMENRDAEDWTQAWDPFENGNNWRQLVRRRRTDVALASVIKAASFAKESVNRAREERAASRCRARDTRAKAEKIAAAAARRMQVVGAITEQAQGADNTAKEALKLLTILARPSVKSAGKLQKRLVIDNGEHGSAQWDTLFRGGMVLETPVLSYIGPTEAKRRFCVATIRRDSRSGAVSVTAAGEDKAVDLYSVIMSAEEVMHVVAEKAGGRRGKELTSPVEVDGAYAAIRRVQEARRKEVLQVLVDALKLDIYQNDLAIGKLFLLRRRRDLNLQLLESLWHRDTVAKRSSDRGREVFRQFQRLGASWATIAVYEKWGDLYFETYDPAVACTTSLQAGVREVLQSLLPDKTAAAVAYLYAMRTGNFPEKLMRKVVGRLDLVLPAEKKHWWRRQMDGEVPHLRLLSAPSLTGKFRGPIWTEVRYTSGKPVTARVLASDRGDFLIEMELRGGSTTGAVEHEVGPGGTLGIGVVLRLEVCARHLRTVFQGISVREVASEAGNGSNVNGRLLNYLLAPDRRVELCRWLLDHTTLEEVRHDNCSQPCISARKDVEMDLQAAADSYKAWAKAIRAPVERTLSLDQTETKTLQHHRPVLDGGHAPGEYSLVLRPDVSSEEHLLPIFEGPWTPDGKVWFHAKISFVQGTEGTQGRRAGGSAPTAASDAGTCNGLESSAGAEDKNENGEGSGLSVTMRPEGARQKRVRLEREGRQKMAEEDWRSRELARASLRLEREARARAREIEEARASERQASLVVTEQVRQSNRLEAINDAERVLFKSWICHDFNLAREAASQILPLLQLEPKPETGPVLTLGPSPLALNRGIAMQLVDVTPNSVAHRASGSKDRKKSSVRSRSPTRASKKASRRRCHGRGEESAYFAARRHPPPLRQPRPPLRSCGFASEHRYQGEGPLERPAEGLEAVEYASARQRPLPLNQIVMILHGEVALVRAVLEPAERCGNAHGSVRVLQTEETGTSPQNDAGFNGLCMVRCVVRIEAYFPGSSTTLCIGVRAIRPAETANTKHDGDDNRNIDVGAARSAFATQRTCWLRTQERNVIVNRRAAEMLAGKQRTSKALIGGVLPPERSSTQQVRTPRGRVQPINARVNNAFSILLVRADMRQPVSRMNLGNGSWKETVGEMLGCPPTVELQTLKIGGPIVFAMDASCQSPCNLKAEKLLDLRVHGDIVWIKARAEEQVASILEADRELTGQERKNRDLIESGRQQVAQAVEQESRRWVPERDTASEIRYKAMVIRKGTRLLPALSRACFATCNSCEDRLLAEARCVLTRAWGCKRAEIGDPSVEFALPSAESVEFSKVNEPRHWDVAKTLLRMHVAACKIPGPACPVPCCGESRASVLQRADVSVHNGRALQQEIDRCMIRFWESHEYRRRVCQRRRPVPQGSGRGSTSEQPTGPLSAPMSSASGEAVRPYRSALHALERATAAIDEPHPGVSQALNSSVDVTSASAHSSSVDSVQRKGCRARRVPSTGIVPKGCSIRLDTMGLLVGHDGCDAKGTVVGVSPREDMEGAVLKGSSQIAPWIMKRLKLEETSKGKRRKTVPALSFDRNHCTGTSLISGTTLVLSVTQAVDGSVTVAGHDPLTCENPSLVLSPSAINRLCVAEGLSSGIDSAPLGPLVARHLIQNASHLLELRVSDDVEALTLVGAADDDSVTSCSQSVLGAGSVDPGTSSEDEADSTRCGRDAQAEAVYNRVRLECRIRRLEVGRRRAVEKRRRERARNLKAAAMEWREIRREDGAGQGDLRAYLTCARATLTAATASFESLVSSDLGRERVSLLNVTHARVVQGRISGDVSKQSRKHRPTSGKKSKAVAIGGHTPPGEGSLSQAEEENPRHSEVADGELEVLKRASEDATQLQDFCQTVCVSQGIGDDANTSSSVERRDGTPQRQAEAEPDLTEIRNSLAGLLAIVEDGPIGLPLYVKWWVGAVSSAEVALKSKYLTPTSKKKGWRK